MAYVAPHPDRPLQPETDWFAEFPREDQLDSIEPGPLPEEQDPFELFAREGANRVEVSPAPGAAAQLSEPAPLAKWSFEPGPATYPEADTPAFRFKRPFAAGAALGVPAMLAAGLFFVTTRGVAIPDLPHPPARAIAPALAAPVMPRLEPAPPEPVVPPPAPTAPRTRNEIAAKPSVPPVVRPTTVSSPPQAPPPSPALIVQQAPGSARAAIAGANPSLVPLPPATPPPPPPEPPRALASASSTAKPAGAPAPVAADPVASAAAEVAAINEVLAGYRRAFNLLNVSRVEQVWPGVDGRALDRAFRGLTSQTFEFDDCRILPKGTHADAICVGRASYVLKIGGRTPQVEGREWSFSLTKRYDRWLIQSVEAKRAQR
jgi:hypothetical protein